MQNIALLLSCLAIGAALRRYSSIPDNAHTALNAFIINVAFPALALLQVHNLHLKPGLAYSVLMPWLLFIVGAGAFWLLGRLFNLRREAIGALMLTGGLGNTSFIGLPMIDAFYGRDDLATGILIDTLGTYLVLSTLGVTIACVYSRRSSGTAAIVRRVLTFPPLIAVVVAIPLMNVQYPTLSGCTEPTGGDTGAAGTRIGRSAAALRCLARQRSDSCGRPGLQVVCRTGVDRVALSGPVPTEWRQCARHIVRSRDGAADRRFDCRQPVWSCARTGHADGRCWHAAILRHATVLVESPVACLMRTGCGA